VEGTILLSESRLTVGPNARLMADIDARDVVVYGFVDGNMRATGRVELRESAVVRGDIVAGRLSIEENASIKGRVELAESVLAVGAAPRADAEIPVATAVVATAQA
jgi:cytoskeletal protein CcmA (bactofilin family)